MDIRSSTQKAAAFFLGCFTPVGALLLLIISIFKFREVRGIFLQDISDRGNRYILSALLFFGILSFIFTSVSHVMSLEVILYILLAIYLYYVLRAFDIDAATTLKYFLFGISILTSFGIFQFIFMNGVDRIIDIGFVRLHIKMDDGRISSLLGNSNLLAGISALGVIIGILLAIIIRTPNRYLYLFLSLLAMGTVLLTQSRNAVVGVILAILLIILYIERKYAYTILTVLVISVAAVMLAAPSIPGQILSRIEHTGSLDFSRKLLWTSAIEMIREHPALGVGAGGFNRHFEAKLENLIINSGENTTDVLSKPTQEIINYYKSVHYSDPHNTFLRLASEWGIPFAIILLGFILYKTFKRLHGQKDITIIILSIGILMIMLTGLTDDPLASGEILSCFLLLNSLLYKKSESILF